MFWSIVLTIHDIPTGLTMNIALTGIQQLRGSISGHFGGMPTSGLFKGIPENGPFEGTITIAKMSLRRLTEIKYTEGDRCDKLRA